MIKNKLLLLLLLISLWGCKQTPLSDVATQTYHYDHQIFEENKLPPRASYFGYESATISEKENSKRFLNLNGDWKFHWVKDPKQRPTTFLHTDFDDSNWTTIPVPANWEVEGFGKPIYLDERYPFTTNWPEAPKDYNPVGTYRKEVILDKDFLSEDVILHFAGAKSAMYVYINGVYVGYSQGSKTPAEFNITPYVKEGKNVIALQMFRWSDASYVESQDMLRMSGIERDVYVYTQPKIVIADYHAITTLDDTYTQGIFNGTISISNASDATVSRKISLSIVDGDTTLYEFSKTIEIQGASTEEIQTEKIIDTVKQWSAELPNLYRLKITLEDESNPSNNQFITKNIGFKRVEIKNAQILINGKPVYFRGVDRHETDPHTGHVVSKESMLKDITLMK